jgi:hypothetical protein
MFAANESPAGARRTARKVYQIAARRLRFPVIPRMRYPISKAHVAVVVRKFWRVES